MVLAAAALIDAAAAWWERGAKPDVAILRDVGWLHWYRYVSLDPEADLPSDLMIAHGLFEIVYQHDPRAVPTDLRDHFRATPSVRDDGFLEALTSSYGAQLLEEALRDDDPAGLDAAVDHLKRIVATAPRGQPDWAGAQSNLCYALRVRFERAGSLVDLDAAVAAGEQAAVAFSAHHPGRADVLSNLGNALSTRFERFGVPADIDAAVTAGRAAVAAAAGVKYPDPGRHLSGLGSSLAIRHARAGSWTDLDEAVATTRAAVVATPVGRPERAARLSNLAVVLRRRFQRSGQTDDLDAAVSAGREALAGLAPHRPERAGALANLGNALFARYERSGAMGDLDGTVEVGREALATIPPEHLSWTAISSNLSQALLARSRRRDSLADLDAAVSVGRDALARTPPDHSGRAALLTGLGLALRARHDRTGSPADLDAAVDVSREAAGRLPDGDPTRVHALSSLSNALRARFERGGAMTDLDEAVTVARATVAAVPDAHVDRCAHLFNLGGAVSLRFERTGASGDLDEALSAFRRVVDLTPGDHPARAGRLSSFGNALTARFGRRHEQADIDEAVVVGREAVAATPTDHPDLASRWSNLAVALAYRHQCTGDLADLDEAVDTERAALSVTGPDHPDRAVRLSNLALSLHTRFERTGESSDLNDAIAAGREALALAHLDHPLRAVMLSGFGNALSERFARTGDSTDLAEAVAAGRMGYTLTIASPTDRLRAARVWGKASAAGRLWSQAAAGYAAATDLIGMVAPRNLARPDQEHRIGELDTLGSDAAACHIRAGMPERALEVLEQGRGVLLGQALDTRTDLTALAESHPDLAARFVALREASDHDGRGQPGSTEAFAELTARIRGLPGFEGFLRPPPARELIEAAGEGTVVVVNVSTHGSHALLLARSGIDVVELDGLTPSKVRERVAAFVRAVSPLPGSHELGGEARPPHDPEVTVNETLSWLWDVAAEPVLAAMGATGRPAPGAPWPRMWWCLSGLLSFLPIHTAGRHETRRTPSPATVIDRVTSSYTPTVRSLARAAHGAGMLGSGVVDGPGLVVSMPRTPGHPDLPGAEAEAELLRRCHVGGARVLTGPDATRERVLDAMRAARWSHFACHGHSDPTDPSNGRLLLHDHDTAPLTVVDVARLRLGDARLAVLSACTTARPGDRLADEAIHLASAFQLAGYRHVLGTLWPISDTLATTVSHDIHQRLSGSEPDVAGALHAVVRALRDALPDHPSLWASHVHIGP